MKKELGDAYDKNTGKKLRYEQEVKTTGGETVMFCYVTRNPKTNGPNDPGQVEIESLDTGDDTFVSPEHIGAVIR